MLLGDSPPITRRDLLLRGAGRLRLIWQFGLCWRYRRKEVQSDEQYSCCESPHDRQLLHH